MQGRRGPFVKGSQAEVCGPRELGLLSGPWLLIIVTRLERSGHSKDRHAASSRSSSHLPIQAECRGLMSLGSTPAAPQSELTGPPSLWLAGESFWLMDISSLLTSVLPWQRACIIPSELLEIPCLPLSAFLDPINTQCLPSPASFLSSLSLPASVCPSIFALQFCLRLDTAMF